MFRNLTNYIKPSDMKIIYTDNKVNIINYKTINIFNDNKIEIYCDKKTIVINGNDLVITRLFDEEILIEGTILSVLFEEIND